MPLPVQGRAREDFAVKLQQFVISLLPPTLVRILAAAVPVFIACDYLAGLHEYAAPTAQMSRQAVTARLMPVAAAYDNRQAAAGDSGGASAAAAPVALLSGKEVFAGVCINCHGAGIAGAPRLGDRKAWAPRIAKGYETLLQHAVMGFNGNAGMMPAKGGGSNLDIEVARAVVYMANQAGANFPEPDTTKLK